MSRVDDLVAELAPQGVAYRRVADAVSVVPAPRGVKRANYGDGTQIPIVDQGQTLIAGYTDDEPASLPLGEYVIFGDHTRAIKWVDFAFAPGADGTKVLTAKAGIEPRFLYYALANLRVPSRGYNRHWTVMRELRIPVPPREVQCEIVRILDHFGELESQLVAEREARREQRLGLMRLLPRSRRILTLSPDGPSHVALGDLATQSVEAVRVEPTETYVNLGVRWYGEGVFARETKQGKAIKGSTLYRVRPGQFIYNRMFVVEGSFGVVAPEHAGGVVSNEFPVYDLDQTRVLPEWLALCFRDEFTLKRVAAQVTGVERGSMKSRRRWKEDQFEAFQIELPSLAAQREVLRIVDAAVALEDALSDELRARDGQYKHYLETLMTLEEAVA